jgi:3-oxoacyl-[acyl-carrier-protein] synthase II
MGASSAIETVLAIVGLERELALPTINYLEDPELVLDCIPERPRPLAAEHLLKSSLGFGGANCCLLLRRTR